MSNLFPTPPQPSAPPTRPHRGQSRCARSSVTPVARTTRSAPPSPRSGPHRAHVGHPGSLRPRFNAQIPADSTPNRQVKPPQLLRTVNREPSQVIGLGDHASVADDGDVGSWWAVLKALLTGSMVAVSALLPSNASTASGNPVASVSSPMVTCGSSLRSLENPGSRKPSPASVSKYSVDGEVAGVFVAKLSPSAWWHTTVRWRACTQPRREVGGRDYGQRSLQHVSTLLDRRNHQRGEFADQRPQSLRLRVAGGRASHQSSSSNLRPSRL